MSNHKRIKIIKITSIVLTALIVVTGSLFFYFFQCMDKARYSYSSEELPLSASLDTPLTRKQAIEDLDYYYRILSTRHLAWTDGRSDIPQKVKARYKDIRSSLQDGVTVLDLYRYISELSAMVGDIHTGAWWNGYSTLLENSDAYEEATESYGQVIAVDGVAYETLLETYRIYEPSETGDHAAYKLQSGGLNNEAILRLCGIDTSDGVDYTFDTEEGEIIVHSDFCIPETGLKYVMLDGGSYIDDSLATIALRSCTYDDFYLNRIEEFFANVKEGNIKNIVIDLRDNPGGSSKVAQAFVAYLACDTCRIPDEDCRYGWYTYKKRNRTVDCAGENGYAGNIYVLINYGTASAAMNFAMIIKDNGLGTVVGQASRNLPDMYTGVRYFSTPNAKLGISVSVNKHYRIDSSVPEWTPLEPDYITEPGNEAKKVHELIISKNIGPYIIGQIT